MAVADLPLLGIENKDADRYVDKKKDKAEAEFEGSANKAAEGTGKHYQGQRDTKKTSLNENQNSNYATNGGQYGRYNQRDYSTTLRLAREADRYNNKPLDHRTHVGSVYNSGIVDRGIGYDRPKLETEEMRAMAQTRDLDTNQKQYAQELQAAVNRKDLDAYIMYYKQLYGIELSRMQAEMQMQQQTRLQQIGDAIFKDQTTFRVFAEDFQLGHRADALYKISLSNQNLANYLANIIINAAAMDQASMLYQEYVNTSLNKYFKQHPGEINYKDAASTVMDASNEAIEDQFNRNNETVKRLRAQEGN